MANVFRSQEVYKKLNKSLHDKNEIVSVRGVYVSGEYKPPYYNETGLRITEISSNKPTVVDFKTETKSLTDTDTVGLLSFDSNPDISIVVYGVEKNSTTDQDTVGLLSFDVNTDLSIYVFEKDYIGCNDTDTVGLLSFDVNDGFNFTCFNKKKTNSTPEPLLRLATISTQPATVENVML